MGPQSFTDQQIAQTTLERASFAEWTPKLFASMKLVCSILLLLSQGLVYSKISTSTLSIKFVKVYHLQGVHKGIVVLHKPYHSL